MMGAFDKECPRCHGKDLSTQPSQLPIKPTNANTGFAPPPASPQSAGQSSTTPQTVDDLIEFLRSKLSESWEKQKNPLAQMLGIAGSISLFLGLFAPVLSAPIIGSISYLQAANTTGKYAEFMGNPNFLIWYAISSFFFACVRIYGVVGVIGILALFQMGSGYALLQAKLYEDLATAQKQAQGNPLGNLAVAVTASVQPQWGWGLLILGPILMFASSVVSELATRFGSRSKTF